MTIGATVIRGRMDAVFGDSRGLDRRRLEDRRPSARGRRPTPRRCNWPPIGWPGPASADIPDDQLHTVRAAFHYVRSNETVTPVDLLDADGLAALIAGI